MRLVLCWMSFSTEQHQCRFLFCIWDKTRGILQVRYLHRPLFAFSLDIWGIAPIWNLQFYSYIFYTFYAIGIALYLHIWLLTDSLFSYH